ncbi:MAG: hypothetical protein JPMHGGIA_02486 [Saprospiraceae bacterium]|nr:hypothetical protein [Saprospiraceae bacterium]
MPLDEQIPEHQGWQAGNRSVQTDGVVFGVKLIQVGCKFFDGIELKTLQMLRQDGMKAFLDISVILTPVSVILTPMWKEG